MKRSRGHVIANTPQSARLVEILREMVWFLKTRNYGGVK